MLTAFGHPIITADYNLLARTSALENVETPLIYSGIGKTSLISELQGPVAEKRGYFIEGKFKIISDKAKKETQLDDKLEVV